LQSVVLLALAGLVGVPYDPVLLLKLLGLLFVGSFVLCGIGVLMSARIKQIQAAMPMSQLIIMPMMFLSGALFPMANLPGWLTVATKLNPLTYVVQPMRAAVFDRLEVPGAGVVAVLDYLSEEWRSFMVGTCRGARCFLVATAGAEPTGAPPWSLRVRRSRSPRPEGTPRHVHPAQLEPAAPFADAQPPLPRRLLPGTRAPNRS
jgi:hypothetical protein